MCSGLAYCFLCVVPVWTNPDLRKIARYSSNWSPPRKSLVKGERFVRDEENPELWMKPNFEPHDAPLYIASGLNLVFQTEAQFGTHLVDKRQKIPLFAF